MVRVEPWQRHGESGRGVCSGGKWSSPLALCDTTTHTTHVHSPPPSTPQAFFLGRAHDGSYPNPNQHKQQRQQQKKKTSECQQQRQQHG